jgi:hypothetical protein
MVSKLEVSIAKSLRIVLRPLEIGDVIVDSDELTQILSGLEWYIPEIIREVHPECETLDGVLRVVARKTGPGEFLLTGFCILIKDQTVTPVHARLQIAPATDEISWLEFRLGQRNTDGTIKRTPYNSYSSKKLIAATDDTESIDWVYKVTYGQHRAS